MRFDYEDEPTVTISRAQHKALMVAAKVLKRYSDYADVYDVLAILRAAGIDLPENT